MIFPQKLDMRGTKDAQRMVEGYINDMQSLIEANDSNLRKRLALLEKADAQVAAILSGEISDVEDEAQTGLADLASRVVAIEGTLTQAGPICYQQPQDATVAAQTAVVFSCKVLGGRYNPLAFQWQHYYSSSWIDCNWSGNDTDTMTVSATSVTNIMNGRRFRCIITGGGWTIYTAVVTLHVT